MNSLFLICFAITIIATIVLSVIAIIAPKVINQEVGNRMRVVTIIFYSLIIIGILSLHLMIKLTQHSD